MGIYKNLFQKINKTDELLLIVMLNNIISNSILYQKPKVCYQFLIKLILTILFILFGFLVFAQKNTISIKDTSITNFMKWLIKSDKTFKAVRNIDNDVSEIKIENFIYYDSIETKNNFTSQNIFKKENKIHQYFTKTDADNFLLQIRRQSRSKWNLKIKNTIF